jgi:hypothetical protein
MPCRLGVDDKSISLLLAQCGGHSRCLPGWRAQTQRKGSLGLAGYGDVHGCRYRGGSAIPRTLWRWFNGLRCTGSVNSCSTAVARAAAVIGDGAVPGLLDQPVAVIREVAEAIRGGVREQQCLQASLGLVWVSAGDYWGR